MISKKIAGVILCSSVLLFAWQILVSSSGQPPYVYAGNPNTISTCNSCHGNGTVNTAGGSITITSSAPGGIYKTDSTYTVTYTLTDAPQVRFGFESIVLNSSLSNAGTFSIINTTNTIKGTVSGRQFVSHVSANANKSWTVNWNAPITNVGPVTFYASGMAGNGNGFDGAGDNVYKGSLTLNPFIKAGIATAYEQTSGTSLYPNPASEEFTLILKEPGMQHLEVALYDVQMRSLGMLYPEVQTADHTHSSYNVRNYPPGIYYIKILHGEVEELQKLLITRN